MKIRVTFELDTEKLKLLNNLRRKRIILDVEETSQKLKDIGGYLDDFDGSLSPKTHYTEEVSE